MALAPSVKLSNGAKMPVLGLGTFLSKSNEGEKAVEYAIDHGYRLFDTAFAYENEKEVGAAIRTKIAEGVIKREDIFITTKLWQTFHEPSKVEYACRNSLKKLGMDYIDLYLMHFPVGFVCLDDDTIYPKKENSELCILNDIDYLDTWKEMEKLVKKGLVRTLGISNFNSEQIDRLLKNCTIKPVINQVEANLQLNQNKLRVFCKDRGITLTAYRPLGLPDPTKKTPKFLYDDKTKAVGAKYNKTPAQVALKYLLQMGIIVIPKSVINSEIEENINIFDFELSPDDMKSLESFNEGIRLCPFEFVDPTHKYYPFNIEY